jgi:hypothetical protein
LAEARLTAGLSKSPLARQSAIKGVAEDLLKRKAGTPYLMPITQLEIELDTILALYAAPPSPPARVNVETPDYPRY